MILKLSEKYYKIYYNFGIHINNNGRVYFTCCLHNDLYKQYRKSFKHFIYFKLKNMVLE